VSYADYMTLMFAFFVVMFASSDADKQRAKQVSESVKKAYRAGIMGTPTPVAGAYLSTARQNRN